jgi:PAS domain S-box-containing protein
MYDGGGRSQLDEMTAAWQQAKEAFEESERRYRNLVEHSLGLICTHDLSGVLLSINPAAAHSLGYEPEHGVGASLADFLDPETRHLFAAYLERIRAVGSDAGLMRVIARDGSVRVWMYRNVLYEELGRPPYVLGHALDITDRVAAERTLRESEQALRNAHAELDRRVQERTMALEQANQRLRVEVAERQRAEDQATEANRLKDEFLGTLSHELRTPLNVIFGWARILRMRQLDGDTAHALEVIERNTAAQLRLIEDIFDVSAIISGKMTLAKDSLDLREVVAASVEAIRPAAHARGVHLEVNAAPATPLTADAQRLQQVFWNVMSNALKFTRSGDRISVTLQSLAGWAEVRISDTGIGIRPDMLPFVFERFRQADSSTTRRHGGLGLGLAIVRHIVELHGGTVIADSAGEGLGATFTIRLPFAGEVHAPTPSESAVTPLSGVAPSRALHARTILVVEDHDDARELVSSVLEAAGATVIGARSTEEALNQLARATPDALLADLGLPDEDGYTLLQRVHALHPSRPMAAVALTAYARATDRDRALAAGYLRYVVKPVAPEELVKVLVAVLDERKPNLR